MANHYFQFKQFRIAQDRCAMKVTTDACIQGAWTPLLPLVKRVLDIGAGTGLLSLMLAQRNEGILIDAIELDANAAAQAVENVLATPFGNRINIVQGNVCHHTSAARYQLIISNPPFFNNSLLSNDKSKDNARHTLSLSYQDLVQAIAGNLTDDGYASILLPYNEYLLLSKVMADAGFKEFGKLSIRHTEPADVNRVVGLFSKNSLLQWPSQDLVIKDAAQQYTRAFTDLLSPYYLYL